MLLFTTIAPIKAYSVININKGHIFYKLNKLPITLPPHEGWKEGNVLFNDALNTFYLWLYGVRHMVKYHTDSDRGNLLPPHGLLFPISSKVFLYALSHRHTTTFGTPVVKHWLEREIAQWVHHGVPPKKYTAHFLQTVKVPNKQKTNKNRNNPTKQRAPFL